MSKLINSQPFDIFSTEKDVVTLRDFTTDSDSLSYKRTAPKRQKDFPGVARSELKLSRVDASTGELVGTVTVTTSIRADASDTNKTAMMAISKAALADSAWTDLINDQRLPLNLSAS